MQLIFVMLISPANNKLHIRIRSKLQMELFINSYELIHRRAHNSQFLSPLILGLLFTIGLPPFHHWYISLISLAIFLNLHVNSKSVKNVFISVFIFSLGNFSLASYWVVNTFLVVIENTFIGYLVGSVTLIVVASYMAIITSFCITLSVAMANKVKTINLNIVLLPLAWAISEYLRSTLYGDQPMHYVAYMVGNNDYLIQLASLLNVYLVSFFLVLISTILSSGHKHTLYAIAVLILGFSFGVYRESDNFNNDTKTTSINVRLVNANLTQKKLLQDQNTFRVSDIYSELSKSDLRDAFIPELIIWPESVLQFYTAGKGSGKSNRQHLTKFLHNGQTLITGGPRFQKDKNGKDRFYSSLLHLNSQGELLGSYDKHMLVPWGEYIPFREFIPKDIADVFGVVDYTPGEGPLSINFKNKFEILPLLCAEGHFPQMISQYQKDQSLIVMIGNEAWLEGTTEPSQYFINAKFRAVESGLPVLLASNKGYLAIINHHGIVQDYTYEDRANVLDGQIEIRLKK